MEQKLNPCGDKLICGLCKKPSTLSDSHIIPEFCYKPLYDEKHRARQVGNTTKYKLLQKGLREKLLCQSCEQLLNDRYEKYFNKMWFVEKALPSKMKANDEYLLENIDYHKFKLFHLSILFRASISSLPEFNKISLGSREEILRRIIYHDIPTTDKQYIILCHALTKADSSVQYGLITSPFEKQIYGYASYGFCFAGCVWYYIVNNEETSKFSQFMLTSNGSLRIYPMGWEQFY